jgi:hypothetical protein
MISGIASRVIYPVIPLPVPSLSDEWSQNQPWKGKKEEKEEKKLPKHKVLKAEFFQDSAKIRPQYRIQLKKLPHQSPRAPRQHVEQVQDSLRATR